MDLHLEGKIALVLAASKGLGRACASALAAEGADMVIGARKFPELEETAKVIGAASGRRVIPYRVDTGQPSLLEKIVEETVRQFGRIDILINNGGGPPFGKFDSFDDLAWQRAYEENLASYVRAIRLVIPHMRRSGGGRIINITSLTVKTLLEGSVLSTSMRLGVVGMAKMLSDELGPDQITVNNIAPGYMLTERVRDTLHLSPGSPDLRVQLEERARQIPLRRLGDPEEVGALACFLASGQAAYITGTTIQVDGGIIRGLF
jgi:3-oxoacyl-[acyl-carrier protein] reductase